MKVQDTEILRRSSVFRFLADEHFAAIEPLLEGEHYEFGDVIVKQDDPADAFYVLTRGRARALKIKPGGEEIPLGVLKPGDSFGEAALSEGGARNATVRCSTAVDVLRLDRDDFTELVRRVPDLKQYVETTGRDRALQSFLYQFSNFGRLPTPVLRAMIDRLKPVTIVKGNLIIREGDDAGPLYIMQKGRARAFAGIDGQTRNLAFYREGDFFGELSVLNGSPRATSVEAFTDCQLLSLEPKSVQDLRRRFPEFDKLLSERLALYQAKTEARIPLDFTTELLPAETHVQNKVELDGQQPPADGEDKEEPFADERGLFRKRGKRIRKIDHVMQIDEMDCGAASLGMICRYFGRKVSLARIRQLCHTATDGTSLKALSRTATELGLAARALKISIRNLSLMPLPAIVHWEGNHWIVLYDVDEQFVRVADPAVGLRKLPRREFEAKWTGYAALFDYTPAFEQAPESKPTLAWFLRFFEPETSLPADDLFHEPPDRRHSAPARWSEAGSAICRPTRSWRFAGSSFSRRRSDFDGDVQSIAHPRVSGNNTALRGTNDFFGKSASPPVSRGGGKPGQIQLASNRCDQRNRGGESGIKIGRAHV